MSGRLITAALLLLTLGGCAGAGPRPLVAGGTTLAQAQLARAAVSFHGEAGRGYEQDVARKLEARIGPALGLGAARVNHGADIAAVLRAADQVHAGETLPEVVVAPPGGVDRVVPALLVWVRYPNDPRSADENPRPAVTESLPGDPPKLGDPERLGLMLLFGIEGATGRLRFVRVAGTRGRADDPQVFDGLMQAVLR